MLQVFLVFFQWINIVSRKADRTQVRFLILTLTFLAFNISWISLSTALSFNSWKEIPTIGFVGILMVGYTCFYITKEIGFEAPKRNAIQLTVYLTGIYSIQQVAEIYLPTIYFEYLVLALVILLQSMALIRVVKLLRPIVESRIAGKLLSPINVATVIITCTYCFSPLLFSLVSESSIEFIMINIPYIIISIAYISHYVKQTKSESKLLAVGKSDDTLTGRFETLEKGTWLIAEYTEFNRNERNEKIAELLQEFELTEKQLEVAIMVLNGLTTKQIAEEINRSEKTVRWHIMHISDKVGVSGVRGIRKKFHEIYYSKKRN